MSEERDKKISEVMTEKVVEADRFNQAIRNLPSTEVATIHQLSRELGRRLVEINEYLQDVNGLEETLRNEEG